MPLKRLEKARKSLPPDYQYPSGGGGKKVVPTASQAASTCLFWMWQSRRMCGKCRQCGLVMNGEQYR